MIGTLLYALETAIFGHQCSNCLEHFRRKTPDEIYCPRCQLRFLKDELEGTCVNCQQRFKLKNIDAPEDEPFCSPRCEQEYERTSAV